MNRLGQLIIILACIISAPAIAAPERISNFALLDQHGVSHELQRYGDHKAVVLISQSNSCQANIGNQPNYRLLRTTRERPCKRGGSSCGGCRFKQSMLHPSICNSPVY